MKTSRLKEIIQIIEQTNINVLQIEEDNFKLYYQKSDTSSSNEQYFNQKNNEALIDEETKVSQKTQPIEDNTIKEISSPMIGTFYTRPEPGADPYVEIGSTISMGDPLCALEAMKLLNEVTSDVNGKILEVLVNDGDVIEYGQSLFKVKVEV